MCRETYGIRDKRNRANQRKEAEVQTHEDTQHQQSFMARLQERAKAAAEAKASLITVGSDKEKPLAGWEHGGIQVRHLPDDEQGILRISIGGGDHTPVVLNYCTIRGSVGECIKLLERAIEALRAAP